MSRPEAGGLLRPRAGGAVLGRALLDGAMIAASLRAVTWAFHHEWTGLLTLAAAAGALLLALTGSPRRLHGSWRLRSMDDELRSALVAWGGTCVALIVAAFALKLSSAYSRAAMFVWFFATPAFLVAARLALRASLAWLRTHGSNARTVAVAAPRELAQGIVRRLEPAAYGLRVSVFDGGSLEDLVEQARRGALDDVFIALPPGAEARVADLVNRLADTTASVYVIPEAYPFGLMRTHWTMLGDMPVVSVHASPFDGLNGWIKRAEDLLIGSCLLAAAALPMAAIALTLLATSGRPVLFRQRRYGLNGKVVWVLKFRTMSAADDGPALAQARRGDARVTRVGQFLRAASLDELPQLFNVLGGAMSLVGPRPHAIAHNEAYRGLIHGYMLRHKVKPGITGWAQVNGWRGETDTLDKMQSRIEHDLAYVRDWSLALDLQILASTLRAVLSRRNAY